MNTKDMSVAQWIFSTIFVTRFETKIMEKIHCAVKVLCVCIYHTLPASIHKQSDLYLAKKKKSSTEAIENTAH